MKKTITDWLIYGAAVLSLAYIAIFCIQQSHWIALFKSL